MAAAPRLVLPVGVADNHAQRARVVHLRQADALARHLAVHAVQALQAALHVHVQAGRLRLQVQLAHQRPRAALQHIQPRPPRLQTQQALKPCI